MFTNISMLKHLFCCSWLKKLILLFYTPQLLGMKLALPPQFFSLFYFMKSKILFAWILLNSWRLCTYTQVSLYGKLMFFFRMNILQKSLSYKYKLSFVLIFFFFLCAQGLWYRKWVLIKGFALHLVFICIPIEGKCCWVSILSLLLVQTNTLLHPLKIGQFVSKQATQHAHSSSHQRAWFQIILLQWYLFSNAGCNYNFVNTAKSAFLPLKKSFEF